MKCECYWCDVPWGPGKDEQGSVVFCPLHDAAEEMLRELNRIDAWFEDLKQDHHEKLVQVQTFKDACANWDNLDQRMFDMSPLKNIIAKASGTHTPHQRRDDFLKGGRCG